MERSLCVVHIAVLTLARVSLTAQELPGPSQNGANRYSLEKEATLGKQLAAEIRERTNPIDTRGVQSFLDRLGQSLAAQMPNAKLPFTFTAIAEDPCRTTHEPVALPGGYIFVPAALLLAAQDEAEFAGMLAHGMEHERLPNQSSVGYETSGKRGRDTAPAFIWKRLGRSPSLPLSLVVEFSRTVYRKLSESRSNGSRVPARSHLTGDG
jgi:hypothetical protein